MRSLATTCSVLTLAAAAAAAGPSKSTQKACAELSAALPDRITTKLAPDYISELGTYWSTTLRAAKPACMVLPRSAEDVAAAVRILAGGAYPDVEFAVKSGGHTPNRRHSSVADGVLISTRDLAGATYDAETGLAYVRPGGEWNDVIGALDEHGVAVVGGRLGNVGVGGYLLQGGISFLSAQYGLAADSIVGWEIVTADGTIKNIDAAEDPELAVALRGSGSQFGIVTQFTIKPYPISQVWGGTRIYAADKADEIYAALHDFVPGNQDDQKAAIILTDNTSTGGNEFLLLFYCYDGPEPPTTGPFAKFLEIGSLLDTTSTRSYAELLKANGQGSDLQARVSFRTFTIPYLKDRPQTYQEISYHWRSLVTEHLNSLLRLTAQCSIDFQPFPAVIGRHSQDRGGNAMGLTAHDPDRILLEIQCSWPSEADDALFEDASRQLVAWLEEKLAEWTADAGEEYYLPYLMNDAAADQNVTGLYRDYAKFKALQKEMDPDGFFMERGGGFTY